MLAARQSCHNLPSLSLGPRLPMTASLGELYMLDAEYRRWAVEEPANATGEQPGACSEKGRVVGGGQFGRLRVVKADLRAPQPEVALRKTGLWAPCCDNCSLLAWLPVFAIPRATTSQAASSTSKTGCNSLKTQSSQPNGMHD